MALILPENIDLEVVKKHSEAEYKILSEIMNFPKDKTNNWVIFYSYYFKNRSIDNRNLATHENNEIDFLFLIPNYGIFVFEIKGGEIIVENGYIYTKNRRTGEMHDIDPYKQAKENYYSLEAEVFGKNYIFGTLVGFPDISEIPNVGLKSNGLDTYVNGMNLYEFIMNNARKQKDSYTYKKVLSATEIYKYKDILNGPNFAYSLSPKDYIKSINLSINQLTEEQEIVFTGLIKNDRCLVEGRAGTGKTVLCEFLYKHYIDDNKKSVIYFTFNKKIANSIRQNTIQNNSSHCYAIYEYIEEKYKEKFEEDFPSYSSWNEKQEELLKWFALFLKEDMISKKYDCLIIDEAQDIPYSEELINVLDLLLNKGLKNGSCYIFYDEKQNIYTSSNKKLYDAECFGIDGYRYTKFELLRNCRNAIGIHNFVNGLISNNKNRNQLEEVSKKIINDNCLYSTINKIDGYKSIINKVKELNNNGVNNNQITILFNYNIKNENNILYKQLKDNYKDKLEEYGSNSIANNVLTYCTVSSFKGLENDVIIYIQDNDKSHNSEHYVAISRAKVYCYIYKVV